MRSKVVALYWMAGLLGCLATAAGQGHQPTPVQRPQTTEDEGAVGRGHSEFKSSCGFCHGNDATGARGPDLVRSAIVNHDDQGNLLGPLIRNGRPDKGMPSFSTLRDSQVGDIVAFLHHQASAALHSARVPGDYPLAKLLTGNADAGKAFFAGEGGCAKCHSVTGDLKGIAKKYSPIELQQRIVYPGSKNIKKAAVITQHDGTRFEGAVVHEDEFTIGIICQDGWYRSWRLSDVEVSVRDPLEAHRELMNQYTDADVHNLFAYLETLK
ncbi:MAG: c-type cytochrome [Acidobacteriaceae bacterium]|nr:c-type cytochrome [Acidobacteriaceae bacterium]MBV9294631.1 c-type cytochrome [Acidobacteriaceae bacterium]MBV9767688.1 c-type cytochrome [Acidobacteriaceae bacterium]